MKYIAAYALLVLGGNAAPKAADVEKVLKEAGIKSEADHVEKVITALAGKPFHELVKNGTAKLGAMGATAVAAPAAAGKAAVAAAPAKKEEAPKEEEADVDMGGLFGDDYWAIYTRVTQQVAVVWCWPNSAHLRVVTCNSISNNQPIQTLSLIITHALSVAVFLSTIY